MALINCPNCNNLVSDKAVRCPKCGIDLTPVENIPENQVTTQVENVKPVSQIEKESADKISAKEDHTLRNILIGIVVLFAICGGMWFYYTNSHAVSTSSNLDIAKILEEVDRDMAAKNNDDALNKQNEEKRLEEFKNFRSNDLAAFMLHGKVKTVTCFSGQCFTYCEFNEEGKLIKYQTGDNHNKSNYEISHDGNSIALVMEGTFGSFGENYRVKDGKLVEYVFGGDGVAERIVYDHHDSNNWAKSKTCYEYDMENDSWKVTSTHSIKYSDIDQYGNWTTSKDEDGYTMESREIEYYPIH